MTPIILFRKNRDTEEEFEIAKQYFEVIEQRAAIPKNSTVICRYSALPFYRELEADVGLLGSKMLSSYSEHSWIADFEYYHKLKEYTPQTWFDYNFYLCDHPGPFIVKGTTNSRKNSGWSKLFAKDKQEALELSRELYSDSLICSQGVVYRKYEPLVMLEEGIGGFPFSNEWRIFYYGTQHLSHGFYWTTCSCPVKASITPEALQFADEIAEIASQYTNFFVLDIAEKQSGGWILIEMNSGEMSGLSNNDPHVLYKNLKNAMQK